MTTNTSGASNDHVECAVIGAGVVGLAIARALARAGRETVIIEANPKPGEETSSRNNEVVHAGFLYPPGSLKERLCASGREHLYRYCAEHGIGHASIGKLMPALTTAQLAILRSLKERADTIGVAVEWLDGNQARTLEPALTCLAALYSPQSGIVDSHALMLALLGDAQANGAMLAVASRVEKISTRTGGGFRIATRDVHGDLSYLSCDMLVNAAGLGAEDLALSLECAAKPHVPRVFFAKGVFYSYDAPAPFRHLIVPLGETLAAGGAFTLDLSGQGRFGPDLQWVDRRDYTVASNLRSRFADAIRAYWPGIEKDRLSPGYAGIRPRTSGPGRSQASSQRSPPQGGGYLVSDWDVQGPREHGIAGLVQLFGIDTPGLTACLTLADHVRNLLAGDFAVGDPDPGRASIG